MPPRNKTVDPIEKLGMDLGADHAAARSAAPAVNAADEVAEVIGQETANAILAADPPAAEQTAADDNDGVDVMVAEAPPAIEPDETRDAAFERRLDRLMVIVEDAEFESGTALGDLRDVMLDLFKTRDQSWHMLDANQRRDLGQYIEKACKLALRRVVQVIAEEDSLAIQGTLLSKWNVSGESLEAKVKIDSVDGEVLADVLKLAGHKVMVISADEKRFASERRPAPQGEGQDDLPFDGPDRRAPETDDSTPPSPPADDSDLAGEDGNDGDADEGDSYGVFDSDAAEWLVNEEGGDEGWTATAAGAGRWSFTRATELAAAFPDTNLTVRHLDPVVDDD